MKTKRIVPAVAGVFLFLSIVLTFVVFLPGSNSGSPQEVSFDEAVAKIKNRESKEVKFKQSQVELTDNDGKKFFASVGSDATRESLLGTIKEYNKINTSVPIRYSEEPLQSGWGWIVLANSLSFFVMWALTLAVIVYAVSTLSRNKS